MSQGTLFIVSAPSGAGKSSLINALLRKFNLEDSLRLSISHTTRQPRPGEVNHESYHFVSVEEFEELIARNAFLEYANVFGNYYGTSREIIEEWLNQGKDVLFDIDWQGARNIKKQMPDAIKIFILPPSLSALQSRLILRGQDSDEVIRKRMASAMSEISHYDEYDYVIINDDFDDSLIALRSIIISTHHRLKSLQQNQQHLFEDMKRQAKEYEEAWLPCASALSAALAAAAKAGEGQQQEAPVSAPAPDAESSDSAAAQTEVDAQAEALPADNGSTAESAPERDVNMAAKEE